MVLLFIFVIVVAILLALGLLWAFSLPKTWTLEQVVLLHLPASDLWPLIQDFHAWADWSIWQDAEAKALGISRSPNGQEMRWTLRIPAVWTLERAQEREQVNASVQFETGNIKLRSILALSRADNHYTQLAWRIQVLDSPDLSNPLTRIKSNVLKNYFESALSRSLQNLQARFPLPKEEESETDEP